MTEKRSAIITLAVTTGMGEAIEHAAARRGLTATQWLRVALLAELMRELGAAWLLGDEPDFAWLAGSGVRASSVTVVPQGDSTP